jgi:hypothetical protein
MMRQVGKISLLVADCLVNQYIANSGLITNNEVLAFLGKEINHRVAMNSIHRDG